MSEFGVWDRRDISSLAQPFSPFEIGDIMTLQLQ